MQTRRLCCKWASVSLDNDANSTETEHTANESQQHSPLIQNLRCSIYNFLLSRDDFWIEVITLLKPKMPYLSNSVHPEQMASSEAIRSGYTLSIT